MLRLLMPLRSHIPGGPPQSGSVCDVFGSRYGVPMVDVRVQARKHANDIRIFRRGLFSVASDSSAWVSSADIELMPNLRGLGPIKSVTDRHAELTVVGDTTDQSAMLEDPTREGVIITLSVAAHHRQLRSRLRGDVDESVAWIVEILGEEWAAHAYAAGALSTTRNRDDVPTLTTQYFYVFIGPDGAPQHAPESFSVPLRRITP